MNDKTYEDRQLCFRLNNRAIFLIAPFAYEHILVLILEPDESLCFTYVAFGKYDRIAVEPKRASDLNISSNISCVKNIVVGQILNCK